jgi:hypothetical protein
MSQLHQHWAIVSLCGAGEECGPSQLSEVSATAGAQDSRKFFPWFNQTHQEQYNETQMGDAWATQFSAAKRRKPAGP